MIFGVWVYVTQKARRDMEGDVNQVLIERANQAARVQGYEPTGKQPSISWIKLDRYDSAVIMGSAVAGDYQVVVKVQVHGERT